ncbi:hypothetical protein QVL82_10360 [Cellulosimicrobium funkei]|uniref:hypothetical protein n=1 Tax=Cellulosimicrobium funkei TaxID=264251 RepID=UPI0037566CBF
MVSQRTPRHRSAAAPAPSPESSPVPASSAAPARRRGGPFARHLRSGPRVAVTTGVAAAAEGATTSGDDLRARSGLPAR